VQSYVTFVCPLLYLCFVSCSILPPISLLPLALFYMPLSLHSICSRRSTFFFPSLQVLTGGRNLCAVRNLYLFAVFATNFWN
jgi:hypothetical protein